MSDPAQAPTRRLFVAVNLPAEVRAAVHAAIAPLADAEPRAVAWVREPNLHVTLRFLGERPVGLVHDLAARLVDVAGALPTFDLGLGGLGAFPSLRRPRVLWIALESNVVLAELYQKVDDACASLGVKREARAFHPHVTVGRVRDGALITAERLEDAVAALSPDRWSFPVNTVDLMSSELGRGGSQYVRLAAAPLAPRPRGGV
ncbi:MAG: RNA 2',3'-cyclic phosphodiesterase [Gemmatirosa sp.]